MKDLKNGLKKQTTRLALLLACTVPMADSSAKVLRIRYNATADLSARSTQARELLGASYERSVANIKVNDLGLSRFVLERTSEMLPQDAKLHAPRVAEAILAESKRYGLDPVFTMSVIAHESRFDPAVVGSHGEIGLMQIKPDTAAWIAKISGIKGYNVNNSRNRLKDPVQNIQIGTAYMSHLRKRFDSHGGYYLAAYNMGTCKLIRTVRERGLPHNYATRVMKHYLSFYGKFKITKTGDLASISESTGF